MLPESPRPDPEFFCPARMIIEELKLLKQFFKIGGVDNYGSPGSSFRLESGDSSFTPWTRSPIS